MPSNDIQGEECSGGKSPRTIKKTDQEAAKSFSNQILQKTWMHIFVLEKMDQQNIDQHFRNQHLYSTEFKEIISITTLGWGKKKGYVR